MSKEHTLVKIFSYNILKTSVVFFQAALFSYVKYIELRIDFGRLGLGCWPLVPKFAASNPAEAIGFLG